MKLKLVLILGATFIATSGFSQFSIGAGLATPIGSHASTSYNSAQLGYQLQATWDKFLGGNYGISSGVILGENPITKNTSIFKEGSWTYLAIEAGLVLAPVKNLKFKTLITAGKYRTPDISYTYPDLSGGVVFTRTIFNLGCNLRIEYKMNKWFVGTNFFYSKPDFDFSTLAIEDLNIENIKSITNLGLIVGYTF